MPSAKVYLLCGKLCSGKTVYSCLLRERYHAVILSVDELALALYGQNPGDLLDTCSAAIKEWMIQKSLELIDAGVSVILDWGFWAKTERISISQFYTSRCIACEIRYLAIPEDERQKQIMKRNQSVLEGNTSCYFVDEGLDRKCNALFEEPDESEEVIRISPEERNILRV